MLVLALVWGTVIVSAFWPVLTLEPAGGSRHRRVPEPDRPPAAVLEVRPSVAIDRQLPYCRSSWSRRIVAIAGRYAGARDLERLQLRWLVASFGAIAVAVIAGFAIIAAGSTRTA